MRELCPGAVLEPAAVPPRRFLGPRPSSLEPIACPTRTPDHEDLSRTGSEWAVPRRRAGASACPRRDFVVLESTPEPQPSTRPQPPPSRTSVRASGSSAVDGTSSSRRGGVCSPPRSCSRHPCPRAGVRPGTRTDVGTPRPARSALSRRLGSGAKSVHRGGRPVWRRESRRATAGFMVPRIHLSAPAHRPALIDDFLERHLYSPRRRIHPRASPPVCLDHHRSSASGIDARRGSDL